MGTKTYLVTRQKPEVIAWCWTCRYHPNGAATRRDLCGLCGRYRYLPNQEGHKGCIARRIYRGGRDAFGNLHGGHDVRAARRLAGRI